MCFTFSVSQASGNIFDLYPDTLSDNTRLITMLQVANSTMCLDTVL